MKSCINFFFHSLKLLIKNRMTSSVNTNTDLIFFDKHMHHSTLALLMAKITNLDR